MTVVFGSLTKICIDIAYHFASAATLILRCALEATNDDTARECVVSAQILISHLRKFKDESNWDLADVCLSQCEEVVRQMSEGTVLDFRRRHAHNSGSASVPSAPNGPNSDNVASSSGSNRVPRVESRSGQHAELDRDILPDVAAAESLAGMAVQGQVAALSGYEMGVDTQGQWNEFFSVPDLWQMDGFDEYNNFAL
jgi:hypothetical protein